MKKYSITEALEGKPELIAVQKSELKAAQFKLEMGTKLVNDYYKMVMNLCGELKVVTLEQIIYEGHIYIPSELSKRFPFPNANEQFNYEAMGINPAPVVHFWKEHQHKWKKFNFELSADGELIPTEKQPYFNQFYHYADTEDRRKAVSLAREVIALFNKLIQEDMIVNRTAFRESFSKALFFLDADRNLAINDWGIGQFLSAVDQGRYTGKKKK